MENVSEQVTVTEDGQIVPYTDAQIGPAADATPDAPPANAVTVPLAILTTTQNELSGGAILIDGAGAQFEADVTANSRILVTKRLPDGSVAGEWLLQLAGVGLSGPVSLDAAGRDVIVFVTGHQGVSTKPRDNYRLIGRIVGVYTTWPTHPGQGEGAYTGGQAEPAPLPAPTGPTAAEIVAAFATALTTPHHALPAALGNLIQQKAEAAVLAKVAEAIRGALDSWARDRVYQGSISGIQAYTERGVREPPGGWT